MKHAHVDETLLHGAHGAESASALGAQASLSVGPRGSPCSRDAAHPFVLAEPDAEPLDQPTRLQCEIADGVVVEEWDARRWLEELAAQAAEAGRIEHDVREPRASAR